MVCPLDLTDYNQSKKYLKPTESILVLARPSTRTVIIIVVIAVAGHNADTCLGKIAAAATAAIAVVVVNNAIAIASTAVDT